MEEKRYLDLYYAAYGSNLNLTDMKERCPNAKYCMNGTLKDHELLFCGSSSNNGLLTVCPKENESVQVGLFQISEDDLHKLDVYEDYPGLYSRKIFDVLVEDGSTVQAIFYVMNEGFSCSDPMTSYYNTCIQGYTDVGIDVGILEKALEKSKK